MAARPLIMISGPGDGARPEDLSRAYEVGTLLAKAGYDVITGGLNGVMEAGSKGATENGGNAIGLLPGGSASDANQANTFAIPTGMGELRNGLLVRAAQAVVVIGGSWGTLSEVALAMRTGVPVVSLGGWSIRDAKSRSVSPAFSTVKTPAQAVAKVSELLEKKKLAAMAAMAYMCC